MDTVLQVGQHLAQHVVAVPDATAAIVAIAVATTAMNRVHTSLTPHQGAVAVDPEVAQDHAGHQLVRR